MTNKKKLPEINLLAALKELSDLMNDDGRVKQIGLQAHLREYNVSYENEVAKWLNNKNYIGYDPKGSHKFPIIFWNRKENPSLQWCRSIYDEIRKEKRKSAAIKKELEKFDDLGQIPIEDPEIVIGPNMTFIDEALEHGAPFDEDVEMPDNNPPLPPGYVDHLGRQTEMEKLKAEAVNDKKVLGWRQDKIDKLEAENKALNLLTVSQFKDIYELQLQLQDNNNSDRAEYLKEALRESEEEVKNLKASLKKAWHETELEWAKRKDLKIKYKKLKKLIKAIL